MLILLSSSPFAVTSVGQEIEPIIEGIWRESAESERVLTVESDRVLIITHLMGATVDNYGGGELLNISDVRIQIQKPGEDGWHTFVLKSEGANSENDTTPQLEHPLLIPSGSKIRTATSLDQDPKYSSVTIYGIKVSNAILPRVLWELF
jgi:hypothetical protein